jgi:hypothetical protein
MKTALLAAAAAALLSASADAAVVRLKDGTVHVGTVVGATAQDIRLLEGGRVLTIETDRISYVDYAAGSAAPAAPSAAAPVSPASAAWGGGVGRHQLSLEVGLTVPTTSVGLEQAGGGRDPVGGTGPAFGAEYLYDVKPRLALGLDLQWLGRGSNSSFKLLSNAESAVGGGSFVFLGAAKLDLRGSGNARPFLLLAAGGHRTTLRVDSQPVLGFVWADTQTFETRRLIDGSSWGPAASARLGLELRNWDPSFFRVEAGFTALSGATYGATPAGRAIGLSGVSAPVQLVTITGRWGWRF